MNLTKMVARGKTYDNRQYIKDQKFRWDPEKKVWWKDVQDNEIDLLVEQFQDECPEVTLECDVTVKADFTSKEVKEEDVPF